MKHVGHNLPIDIAYTFNMDLKPPLFTGRVRLVRRIHPLCLGITRLTSKELSVQPLSHHCAMFQG